MKKMMKRTAAVTLAGIMSVGMLTGCGSKTIDGTKTVATVDGTEIPLGVVSLYARQQQEQTDSALNDVLHDFLHSPAPTAG